MHIVGERGEVLLLRNWVRWLEHSVGSTQFQQLFLDDSFEPEPLHNGDLSCAWFMSFGTKAWGLSHELHTWVNYAVAHYLTCGWYPARTSASGAIVVYGKKQDGTHRHIGGCVSETEVVSNSSRARTPQRHPLALPSLSIELILKHPHLHGTQEDTACIRP